MIFIVNKNTTQEDWDDIFEDVIYWQHTHNMASIIIEEKLN